MEIPKNSTNKYSTTENSGFFAWIAPYTRRCITPVTTDSSRELSPKTTIRLMCSSSSPSRVSRVASIEVRPVGILNMVDSEEGDQKVLAVPTRNPRYDQIHTMDQIFSHVRREIEHFFTIYKELEGRLTRMEGWGGPREARKAIVDSRSRYLALQEKSHPPIAVAQ